MTEALLVAHGAPNDPAPQEAVMQSLAHRVAQHLPGWQVRGVTLAAPGALEAGLDGLLTPLIYPFFMAEGWFTRTNLPRRLKDAGRGGLTQLPPFGTDPALFHLICKLLHEAGASNQTPILIAAHGSKRSKTSSGSTWDLVTRLQAEAGFQHVAAGFVEEAPFLADAARSPGPKICLPFFALRAGHVVKDVPEALATAGFSGQLLPPVGEDPRVPELIAAALRRAQG